jgi:hypothetical protein
MKFSFPMEMLAFLHEMKEIKHWLRTLGNIFLHVAYVSHIWCKCFIRTLHMFHTYITSVSSRCCICFAMAIHVFS